MTLGTEGVLQRVLSRAPQSQPRELTDELLCLTTGRNQIAEFDNVGVVPVVQVDSFGSEGESIGDGSNKTRKRIAARMQIPRVYAIEEEQWQ